MNGWKARSKGVKTPAHSLTSQTVEKPGSAPVLASLEPVIYLLVYFPLHSFHKQASSEPPDRHASRPGQGDTFRPLALPRPPHNQPSGQ